jgi:hypothetical protein
MTKKASGPKHPRGAESKSQPATESVQELPVLIRLTLEDRRRMAALFR